MATPNPPSLSRLKDEMETEIFTIEILTINVQKLENWTKLACKNKYLPKEILKKSGIKHNPKISILKRRIRIKTGRE